jgi:hypothetical protein
MARKQKRPESLSGGFAAVPWAVMDGEAFQGATPRAKAMLFEVIRRLDGRNNGHVFIPASVLRERGWKSTDAITAAKVELLARGLILKTKTGGLNLGPDLYAVTWLNISNFAGLEVGSHQYHPGAWRFVEDLPATKRRHSRAPEKRERQTASRSSTVPPHGLAGVSTVPPHGAETAHFDGSARPPHGHKVIHQLPPVECSPARTLEAVQQFQSRIGGKLLTPEREPNPLGRTRHIRLFKTAAAHLFTHQPTPANSGQTRSTYPERKSA